MAILFDPGPAAGAPGEPVFAAGGRTFQTWQEYYASDFFQESGKRCGKPKTVVPPSFAPSDCSFTSTNPSSEYATTELYQIPVVVHVIESSGGQGRLSDALVRSQIEVLNEDFRALAGTPGAGGWDTGIQFVLATTDPAGQPTTGVTRSVDDGWFADQGAYWNALAWDTSRYLNVYTNEAGGHLGYVPSLPQGGIAGNPADRVVVLWSAFGRGAPGGPPYDQGRTLTHEVGHYLGLEHTFAGGCDPAAPPGCYSSGDLICDTNSAAGPTFGCPLAPMSCGTPDPVENYMDYGDDGCMELFTEEQSHRMRCSLTHYRADLFVVADPAVCGNGVAEPGELCDGADDAACPGACLGTCACPSTCGNAACDPGEDATTCLEDCGCAAQAACGGQAQGCYCDPACAAFGDCCPDACSACDAGCPLTPGCGATPDPSCRPTLPFGATLTLKDQPGSGRDRFVWTVRRGAETTLADFLDPTAPGKIASVCLYDASPATQPLFAAAVASGGQCNGKPCWKAQSDRGFQYAAPSGDPDGIVKMKLRAGDEGRARLQVTGRGDRLDSPALPLVLPVTVQLLIDDGATRSCWETGFGEATRNQPGSFQAKGP